MYIDFTGGTKAMSAAMAMAGALIDVQLVYVESNDYLADFRIPNPGSETLFYINNPVTVFGDLDIEKALVLFERFNYAGAKDCWYLGISFGSNSPLRLLSVCKSPCSFSHSQGWHQVLPP